MRGIVGGDPDLHSIAEHDADEVLPHLASDPRLDLGAVVVELHGEETTRVNVGDYAFNFDEIVASQSCSSLKAAGSHTSRVGKCTY